MIRRHIAGHQYCNHILMGRNHQIAKEWYRKIIPWQLNDHTSLGTRYQDCNARRSSRRESWSAKRDFRNLDLIILPHRIILNSMLLIYCHSELNAHYWGSQYLFNRLKYNKLFDLNYFAAFLESIVQCQSKYGRTGCHTHI